MSVETGLWIAAALAAGISALMLRATVRLASGGADNGWDNAIVYVGVTALLIAYPVAYLLLSGHWALMLLAPGVLFAGQVWALSGIYEVSGRRALWVGALHSVLTTVVVGALSLLAAAVVVYLLYGKVISDPVLLIKLILRLIGVPIPIGGPGALL